MLGLDPSARVLGLLLSVLAASSAAAIPPRTAAEKARAYAERNDLPFREVPIDLPGRKGTRLVVPVTEATLADFLREFSTDDALAIRQAANDVEHLQLVFGENELSHRAQIAPGPRPLVPIEVNGAQVFLGLGFTPEVKAYLRAHLTDPFDAGLVGGCMRWLLYAKVADGLSLAHHFGVRNSVAPNNLVKKLIHAGTDEVVVGVPINLSEELAQASTLGQRATALTLRVASATDKIADFEAQERAISTQASRAAPYLSANATLEALIAERASKPLYERVRAKLRAQIEAHGETLAGQRQERRAQHLQHAATLAAHATDLQAQLDRQAGGDSAQTLRAALATARSRQLELEAQDPEAFDPAFEAHLDALDSQRAKADRRSKTRANTGALRALVATLVGQERQKTERLSIDDPGIVNAREADYAARIAAPDLNPRDERALANHKEAARKPVELASLRGELDTLLQASLVERRTAQYRTRLDALTEELGALEAQLAVPRERLAAKLTELAQSSEKPRAELEAALTSEPRTVDLGALQRQELAHFDALIAADLARLGSPAARQPTARTHAAAWRQILKSHQKERARIAALAPGDFHPAYDAAIAALDLTLTSAPGIGVAEALRAQRAELDRTLWLRETLVARGPAAYDPELAKQIMTLKGALDQTELTAVQARLEAQAQIAQIAAQQAAAQRVTAELRRRGPALYEAGYDARLTELAASTDAHAEQQLATLTAMGPEGYHAELEGLVAAQEALIQDRESHVARNPGVRHEDSRLLWRRQIEVAHQKIAELRAHDPLTVHPLFDARVAGLRGQIALDEAELARLLEIPHSEAAVAAARARASLQRDVLEALLARGPQGHDTSYDQAIAAALTRLKDKTDTYVQAEERATKAIAGLALRAQANRDLRAELRRQTPQSYQKAYADRWLALQTQILEKEAWRGVSVPDALLASGQEALAKRATELAALHNDLAALEALGPEDYNPAYVAAVTKLETDLQNRRARAQVYAPIVFAAEIAGLEAERDALLALRPRDFHPDHFKRRAELVSRLGELAARLPAAKRGPKATLRALQRERERVSTVLRELDRHGLRGFDSGHLAALMGALEQVDQTKEAIAVSLADERAEQALAGVQRDRLSARRATLVAQGPARFNPHLEARIATLTAEAESLERALALPAVQAGVGPQRAQLAALQSALGELRARDPEQYRAFEPQIQALQTQLVRDEVELANVNRELNAGSKADLVRAKFMALSDADVLGAPPGSGAAEAVHR